MLLNTSPFLPSVQPPTRRPRLTIISAALPPQLDGIGDYTSLLATELASNLDVTVLTDNRTPSDPIPRVSVQPIFNPEIRRSVWNIADAILSDPPDWLLLQYNPFAYGRWGLNLDLPRVLRRIRRAAPNVRIAVMMHETYVALENWKFAIMTTWQRWQCIQIGRAADVLCFSIQPWAQSHSNWFPNTQLHHLPVGSNVPRIPISRASARSRLNIADDEIILGVFGTAHVSRRLEPICSATRSLITAGKRVRILYIGPHADTLRKAMGNVPLIAEGPIPADEVSCRMSAMDIFLATYSDGISTRRGAMMAALQHAIPVVGTRGHHTDPELLEADNRELLLVPSDDPAAFDAAVAQLAKDPAMRSQIGSEGQQLFRRRFSWPAIAANLLNVLQIQSPT